MPDAADRRDADDTDDRWTVLLPSYLDPSGPDSIRDIAEFVSIDDYDSHEALLADAPRFDAIVCRTFDVPGDLVEAATTLKVISNHGVGLDNVAIDAASTRGIPVCNTPGANADAVAEHALALLFAVRRQVPRADADVRAGEWDRHRYVDRELGGTTLGILGCGNIGSRVARLADGVGMDLRSFDPYLDDADFPESVTRVGSLLDLFRQSDAVTVHVPLTDETDGFVNAAALDALGSDGLLVNTARGGVVDEDAIVAALENGTIRGAGLDVLAAEPPRIDHPLFDLRNVVLTPHVGALSTDALERMSTWACENVRTVYDGDLPETTVNADAC